MLRPIYAKHAARTKTDAAESTTDDGAATNGVTAHSFASKPIASGGAGRAAANERVSLCIDPESDSESSSDVRGWLVGGFRFGRGPPRAFQRCATEVLPWQRPPKGAEISI